MSTPARYRACSRWTAAEARAALGDLHGSGLSVAAFAEAEGLDPQRLYAWRRKLGATPKTAMSKSAFIEVVRRQGERIEIVLRSGIVLRVSDTIDGGAVRRLVDALDHDPC